MGDDGDFGDDSDSDSETSEGVDDGVGEDGDDDDEFAATTFQKAMHDVLMEYKRRA